MSNMSVRGGIKAAEMSAVVIRCGCPEWKKTALSAIGMFHAQRNEQCPNPKMVEDLGTIVRYSINDK